MYDEYINGRNAYQYPNIGLCCTKKLDNVANWQKVYKQHQFNNTLELDIHHNANLLSKDDHEVMLGIYSVMYWGNITAGAKSITRCEWLSVGNASNKEHSLSHLGRQWGIDIIRKSKAFIDAEQYAEALTEIRKLPHVGVSFGTKFLAFIDPENIGILDDKISRHLASDSFKNILDIEIINRLRKPQHESIKAASERFHAFCDSLNVIKKILNNNQCGWRDVSGAEMCRFRAIDVERALFSIAKQLDNA